MLWFLFVICTIFEVVFLCYHLVLFIFFLCFFAFGGLCSVCDCIPLLRMSMSVLQH